MYYEREAYWCYLDGSWGIRRVIRWWAMGITDPLRSSDMRLFHTWSRKEWALGGSDGENIHNTLHNFKSNSQMTIVRDLDSYSVC